MSRTGTLRIDLDHPGKIYRPNEDVTGRIVHLSPAHPPDTVQLVLEGRAKCKTYESRAHQNRARQVFRSRALLLRNAYVLRPAGPDGNHTFSISFPTNVQEHNNMAASPQDEKPGYWSSFATADGFQAGQHPLPPSLDYGHNGFGGHFECYIRYTLYVEVVTPTRRGSSSLCKKVLRFVPESYTSSFPQRLLIFEQTTCVQSLRLLPQYERIEPTLKEKAKARLLSTPLPSFQYKTALDIPQYLFLGDPSQITVTISSRTASADLSKEPPLTLMGVQVALRCTVYTRCSSFWRGKNADNTEVVWKGQARVEGESVLGPTNDYTKIVTVQPFPANLFPSFATYNIRADYELSVKALIECAGSKSSPKRTVPVQVISRGPNVTIDHARNSLQNQGGDVGSTDYELPSYQTATGPSSSGQLPGYRAVE